MEAGNRANNSGVKPIQEAATLPVKLQYFFFMKSETAQVKTATYNSWRQVLFESSLQKLYILIFCMKRAGEDKNCFPDWKQLLQTNKKTSYTVKMIFYWWLHMRNLNQRYRQCVPCGKILKNLKQAFKTESSEEINTYFRMFVKPSSSQDYTVIWSLYIV